MTQHRVREELTDIINPAHTALLVVDVQNDLCRLSDMSTAEYFAQCLAAEWEPVRPGGDDGAAWCTMV